MRKRNQHFMAATCLLLTLCTQSLHARSISMDDYVQPDNTYDCTPTLRHCIESLDTQDSEHTVLHFSPGTYHFYPDMGYDEYCFISNNDEGLKRVIFLLKDLHNLEIDGHGAEFIFHGFVNPFVITGSSNISFRNFSVDYARTFHSEGIISAIHNDGVEIEIPKAFPYDIKNHILLFTDVPSDRTSGKETTVTRNNIYPYNHILEFDTRRKETAYMARDYFLGNTPLAATDLGNRKVRIYHPTLTGQIGNTLVFGPNHRKHPAFTATDSRDIKFQNVTIHHAGGMGIIGQRVHNVTVDHCTVAPSGTRILSTTADATHFTNCTGRITLSHNVFTNQMDDATNIHGIYVRIREITAPDKVTVELCHPQQYGFDFITTGTDMELVKGKSLITVGTAKVSNVKRINKNLTEVTFAETLPTDIHPGDAMCEVRDYPQIHIHDNYIGKNRARGMLLNCRGTTVVERNTFHSPGAAILFEGDACFWYEQGGVSDCTIRDNIFDECLFGVWGKAVIDVAAGIHEDADTSRYNRNIKIYGNRFRTFDNSLLLNAYGVDHLDWKNNHIEMTDGYVPAHFNPTRFKVEHCDHITIDQK